MASPLQSQTVYEHHKNEVYNFLFRMAQKGMIDFDDAIRPVTRSQIILKLKELKNANSLSVIEKNELNFYLQEFNTGGFVTDTSESKLLLMKVDSNNRWRGFKISGNQFQLQADPLVQMAYTQGGGKNLFLTSTGIQFWGTAGKGFSFQFYFKDTYERGKGFDSLNRWQPTTGIVRKDTTSKKSLNYSEVRANIAYTWKNGSISFGQDYLLMGYGENGRLNLSDKSPPYPQIRLHYQPVSWLKFYYTHAWLNSQIVDSNRLNTTTPDVFGGKRIVFIPKFMATHGVSFRLMKGLEFMAGESIVYSDKLDAGFFIPLNFFKLYDNIRSTDNINAGSNGQLFFQLSSRNQIPKTHVYSSIFIDEISTFNFFNKQKRRNQFGYNLGFSTTDIAVDYLTIGAEYTRNNPFVYSNLIPAQHYTNYNYSLGDWMGNNFDRKIVFLKYTPVPRLKLMVRYQHVRKGGAGTIAQQYFQQPQPPFLFNKQFHRRDWLMQMSYEWTNNLYLQAQWESRKDIFFTSIPNQQAKQFSIGIYYGW